MNDITLPPVNRGFDPLLCPHGMAATYMNDKDGSTVTVSVLCELIVGHEGMHFAPDVGDWDDPE